MAKKPAISGIFFKPSGIFFKPCRQVVDGWHSYDRSNWRSLWLLFPPQQPIWSRRHTHWSCSLFPPRGAAESGGKRGTYHTLLTPCSVLVECHPSYHNHRWGHAWLPFSPWYLACFLKSSARSMPRMYRADLPNRFDTSVQNHPMRSALRVAAGIMEGFLRGLLSSGRCLAGVLLFLAMRNHQEYAYQTCVAPGPARRRRICTGCVVGLAYAN